MCAIKKQIVINESMQPVAVIIDYSDWQNIEVLLQNLPETSEVRDLSIFAGTISLPVDPLVYQQQIRSH
jgi:hypothetical protein